MKIEIEVHQASARDGQPVRVRVVREIHDDDTGFTRTVILVRDHDSGIELSPTGEQDVFRAPTGETYRLHRQLA